MKRVTTWFERKLRSPRHKLLFEQERLILRATEEICRTMGERGLSKAAVAGRIGKSKAFVTQVLSGQRNMTLRTLAELAWACGCTVNLRLSKSYQEQVRQRGSTLSVRSTNQAVAVGVMANRQARV